MPLIYLVAGARPNFMKIAPIVRALQKQPDIRFQIVHTGQHYDYDMSGVFFEQLGIPMPDAELCCGGGSHAEQTARVMIAFEAHCLVKRPDAVLVVGDVNSTLACTLTAKKLGIPVAHVEAGLRSGDMTMPEEINRVAIDSLADWLFVTEPSGLTHLQREGKRSENVHFVGHVMIDNLFYQLAKLEPAEDVRSGQVGSRKYGVVTLHRPSNVDCPKTLRRIVAALRDIAQDVPLIFPVHPRTTISLSKFEIDVGPRISLIGPQAYVPFLKLWKDAAIVLTDSGGIQEETTAIGVPCVTIRDSTERPITVEMGSNVLVGTEQESIVREAKKILQGRGKQACRPPLWDGKASDRIVAILTNSLRANSEPFAQSSLALCTPSRSIVQNDGQHILIGELL